MTEEMEQTRLVLWDEIDRQVVSRVIRSYQGLEGDMRLRAI